jgi:cyclophilin family peptidyl-prolyl cis-trans isomerase
LFFTLFPPSLFGNNYNNTYINNNNRKGLLTRRQLTNGPEFGITLKEAAALDGFHVIFGIVLQGIEVLDAISLVPTYSYKTKTGL